METGKPDAVYLFPNDIEIIRNNGERYPVPKKDNSINWHDWIVSQLLEKEICSREIFDKVSQLTPFFSTDGKTAYFGPDRKEYDYLHRIKTEDGHNYIYRVWLQLMYDEMVLGQRSPRVLRLASYGDESANTYKKWDELTDEVSRAISNAFSIHKDGYVLKDIYLLSEAIKIAAVLNTEEDSNQESESLIDRIARETVKILIADSNEKVTTEWAIYQQMKKKEIIDWFNKSDHQNQDLEPSDLKKPDLINWLIANEIKPPDYDLKNKVVRCLPNPMFFSKIVRFIKSELNKVIEKYISDNSSHIGPGNAFGTMLDSVRKSFSENEPLFGHMRIDGKSNNSSWSGKTLEWRISKGSEHFAYEILRILVCDLEWITLEKGEYEDIDIFYNEGDDDKIAQKMKDSGKIPIMIYFTEKLTEERIPNGVSEIRKASPAYWDEKSWNEIHPIYRYMSGSIKRWMYCEPEEHIPGKGGGYINPGSKESILGARRIRNLSKHNLKFENQEFEANWPERTVIGIDVCRALNNLQKTQWEVNFDFINEITEGFKITNGEVKYHGGNDKLILKDFIASIFSKPIASGTNLPKYVVTELREDVKIRIREIENSLASSHKAIRNGDNVFWHSWACDWRGRFNTSSNALSPQGSDFSKALIRFKEWKVLGNEGWKWFKVHVCNLFSDLDFNGYFASSDSGLSWDEPDKYSKKPFQDRDEWTERHKDSILHIYDKINEPRIMDILELNLEGFLKPKSEAFQRLSVIIEFKRILGEYEKIGDWNKIKSGMPVHLDASCNGFQHAAALLENKELAKKVNLLKPDDVKSKAQDLYGEIAEYATSQYKYGGRNVSKLRKFIEDNKQPLGLDDVQIEEMSGIFTRNLMKRPTIMVGYGASKGIWEGIISRKEGAKPPEVFEKKTRVKVWHPESPLYKSVVDNIPGFKNLSWPSKLQVGFAKNVAKDIMDAIRSVTNDSFEEIGRRKLFKVQDKLMKSSSKIDESNLLGWQVMNDDGVTIKCFKPEDGAAVEMPRPGKVGKVKATEQLREAFELLHPKKDWKQIEEMYELPEYWKAELAKIFLRELMDAFRNDKFTAEKLEDARQYANNMFRIAYIIKINLDEHKRINSVDYKTGATANFVHSLDAAHMRNVINSMAKEGIDSFWSVHDSFGTHAADIGKMREIINKEFVELHKGRNINWWCEQMYSGWDSSDDDWDWDRLDLDEVLESEFLVG